MNTTMALCVCVAMAGADPVPKLSGGFVQLDDEAMKLTPAQWKQFLGKTTEIGLDTLLVQRLEFVGKDGCLHKYYREAGTDPVEELLRYADHHKMTVFVGLQQDERWDDLRKKKDTINKVLDANKKLADKAWSKYNAHESFAGWYVAQELANYKFSPDEIALLQSYFKTLSQYCKNIKDNKKDVAISPYFNPASESWLTGPDDYKHNLKKILDGSEVNIVMLQDSVGARNIKPEDFEKKLVPFYEAVKTLASDKRKFWANVESFEETLIPTTFDRFEAQLRTARKHANVIVTFDCYHYLNPLGFSHSAAHKAAEEKLYKAYKEATAPKK